VLLAYLSIAIAAIAVLTYLWRMRKFSQWRQGLARFRIQPQSSRISVEWRGREVTRQPQRFLVVCVVVVLASLAVTIGLLSVALSIVICILSVPLHILLRIFGRRGFLVTDGGSFSYTVNANGFKQAGRW
jgi:hypothetical protein